jgi:hypothetical protein
MNDALGSDTRTNVVPLTHHQVLALAEPFLRHGYTIDPNASARERRRTVFRRALAATPSDGDVARDTLSLETHESGGHRLVRSVEREGLVATVRASGRDLPELFDAVTALPPERQFLHEADAVIALHYDLDGERRRILSRAQLQAPRVELTLSIAAVRGVAAEVNLSPRGARHVQVPEDLLAVLGWDWSPLTPVRQGWQGRLRLRGSPEQRGLRAVNELTRVARHLQEVLSRAPGDFHDLHRRARWGVVARRLIPWLTVLSLAIAVGALPRLVSEPQPATLMLIFHVPTVLIALSFCLQERAKFEFPPIPRRSPAANWFDEPTPVPARETQGLRWWNSPFR